MATDKRLDQVSQLTDFDYALIVKGDQVAKISSEQLASVMAGLMGNPLRRESVVTAGNVDGALKPGFYTMVFEPISIGGGTHNFYGVMNVYESETYTVQVGYATSGVILRNYRKSSKVWSAWQRIDNFGANTLAEFSSMVAGQMGNKLFANPISINGKTVGDTSLESGAYLFSGSLSEGLTSYSGILFVSGESTGTQVRLLIGKDVIAFKRSDSNWFKITATEVTT